MAQLFKYIKVGILHTEFETRVCQLSWIWCVCVYRKNKIYTILCSTVVGLKYNEWVYIEIRLIYTMYLIHVCVFNYNYYCHYL